MHTARSIAGSPSGHKAVQHAITVARQPRRMAAQASMETFEGKLAELPSSGAYVLFKGRRGDRTLLQADMRLWRYGRAHRRRRFGVCPPATPQGLHHSSSRSQNLCCLQPTGAQTACAAPRRCRMLWQPPAASCWRLTSRPSPQARQPAQGLSAVASVCASLARPPQARALCGTNRFHADPGVGTSPGCSLAAWKTPTHPLRKDPRFQLGGIPTLVFWRNGAVAAKLGEHRSCRGSRAPGARRLLEAQHCGRRAAGVTCLQPPGCNHNHPAT